MEELIRTFIAIELSQDVRALLDEYSTRLQNKFPSGFRWVRASNIHLTLKFLGDTTPNRIQQVSRILHEICLETKPYLLQLDQTGAFPTWQRPRTFWIGLRPSNELLTFYKAMDSSLIRIGFPTEGKKFSPHLTICRVSDHAEPRSVQLLSKEIQFAAIPDNSPWTVNKVNYYRSILKPGGPIYSVLSEHLFEK